MSNIDTNNISILSCNDNSSSNNIMDASYVEGALKCFRKKCYKSNESLNRSVHLIANLKSRQATFSDCINFDTEMSMSLFKVNLNELCGIFSKKASIEHIL